MNCENVEALSKLLENIGHLLFIILLAYTLFSLKHLFNKGPNGVKNNMLDFLVEKQLSDNILNHFNFTDKIGEAKHDSDVDSKDKIEKENDDDSNNDNKAVDESLEKKEELVEQQKEILKSISQDINNLDMALKKVSNISFVGSKNLRKLAKK